MKTKFVFIFSFFQMVLWSQSKPAYTIFNTKGKKVSYTKMMKSMQDKELIFFGEFHDNPISHWLEYEITNDLGTSKKLMLGAEMFEADNQGPLNQYLQSEITAKQLDSMSRLWKNYPTDYAPLVELAKKNKWPFIATNIPRKYASQVARKGLESLDTLPMEVKNWIAPLPIAYDPELACYKNMLTMMPGHGGPNLPKAQAIKDATMAHFILANIKSGIPFVHYNGAYHSENHQGIVWYIKNKKPEIRYTTITTVSQEDLKSLETAHKGKADFIICVDAQMTPTYK